MNNKTKLKTISVVMCTYNGEKFIREQLDSIVSQTYPIYELIIQDDCSTDNTIEIIQEYASKYKFIKPYKNKKNIGFNKNFKEAILKATGDYIAISDQDDIWYKDKLKIQLDNIGKHSLCTSSYHKDTKYEVGSMKNIITPTNSFEYHLFTNSIPGHTMLIDKEFVQNFFTNWSIHIVYDWWIVINAYLSNGIICVNTPLNWHRPHSNSAITLEFKERNKSFAIKPSWQPYIYGYKHYRKLQQLPVWTSLYTYIVNKTNYPPVYNITKLLLRKDFISFLHLSWLCLKSRKTLGYSGRGIMTYIRAFFYPLIRAYGNINFSSGQK